ncbi:hypothetical protein PYW07_002779 [Mythimna separata]|uniref:Sperm microtubule inner protein 1 C-terminal domain-containing protein n=1 Tax=Mythimna separata TaxID=271217 RepID=A0AAD7YGI4_MYTSE|nr:hypothetical protein PYW07_002779 [Mythimna separata]
MPLMDTSDPYVIRFLIENYEKNTKLRMRWNNLHKEKLNEAATLQREEKRYSELDVLKASLETLMPAVSRDHKNGARNRRLKPISDSSIVQGVAHMQKGHSIVDVGLGDPKGDPKLERPDTDLSSDPIMRPIDPKEKEILYKGRPFFGRKVYLKKRHTRPPEDRYYFAESRGWDYGWRLKDSYFRSHGSQYGCVNQLARERSRSGPAPDPKYYRNPAYKGTRCSLE